MPHFAYSTTGAGGPRRLLGAVLGVIALLALVGLVLASALVFLVLGAGLVLVVACVRLARRMRGGWGRGSRGGEGCSSAGQDRFSHGEGADRGGPHGKEPSGGGDVLDAQHGPHGWSVEPEADSRVHSGPDTGN